MDIGSGNKYPAASLSNFCPHPFIFRGISCSSVEGFLQSLKFKSPEMQVEVCKLVGKAAKFKGKKKKWWRDQILYWQGIPIKRQSQEYQDLISEAYDCMFRDSGSFQLALRASGDAVFTHSMGKNDPTKTVLTTTEFCRQLNRCRDKLKK